MYRVLAGCFLVCILVCQRWRVSAAPLSHHKTKHDKDVSITIIVDGHVPKSMMDNADARINILHSEDAVATTADDVSKPSSRARRVRRSHVRHERASSPAVADDDSLSDATARRRRSVAAFWLQGSIELCNNERVRCRRIVVVDGNTTINIRLEDM